MRYPINDGTHKWALAQCTESAFNGTTILKGGTGQYVGYIGEAIFGMWLAEHDLPFDYIASDSFDADFTVLGLTFDVKSKNRNVLPRPDYAAHIASSQKKQACMYYVFTSVLMARDRAACCDLLGWIRKDQFWSKCEEVHLGENQDGLVERASAGKLPYSALGSMDALANNLKVFLKAEGFG